LKESGRNVLVELKEDGRAAESSQPQPHGQPHHDQHQPSHQHRAPAEGSQPRAAEAVTEVRRLFQAAQQPPRWPMYVRQVKQYLRSVDPSFDERKFGFHSLNDLLRACQREGLFRVERDRQGVVRFFQGNVLKSDETAAASGINPADIEAAERLAQAAEAELAEVEAEFAETGAPQEIVEGDVVREEVAAAIVDVEAPPPAPEVPADALTEEPATPPRRKRAAAPRGSKATREAGEKKAPKPRGSRRKLAVAADA
jgi:hypothetical protein